MTCPTAPVLVLGALAGGRAHAVRAGPQAPPDGVERIARASRLRLRRARTEYLEAYLRFLVASYRFEAAVDAALVDSPALAAARASGFAAERAEPAALIRDDLCTLFGDAELTALGARDELAPARPLPGFAGTEFVRRGSRAGAMFVAMQSWHARLEARVTRA